MLLEAKTAAESPTLSASIVKTLLYFDIFRYPLLLEEIVRFCSGKKVSGHEVQNSLQELTGKGIIFSLNGYYFLSKDAESRIARREKGNLLAEKYMRKASQMSRIIARFPYVRGICLSGSLSKGYVDEKGDIDYFIMTHPERLWVCRTLLILFKKIFLLNSRKYFCLNYFIGTKNLEIEEKNIFTATEITTLIPTYGENVYAEFMRKNAWVQKTYPCTADRCSQKAAQNDHFIIKHLLEAILNTSLGEMLDHFFMRTTLFFWKIKFRGFDPEEFRIAFKSKKNISKHHPGNFQKLVLSEYQKKVSWFETKHNLSLN